MATPTPKPGIMNIQPYVGGESSAEGVEDIIKISSNESPLGPSPAAMAAYQDLAAELHRYPDGGFDELRHALAEMYDLNADNIVCGNGSDELIGLLTKAYAGIGDEVLFSKHGFLMYPISAMAAGATPVTADEDNYTASVDALLAKVTDKTSIVFLANPNNPTGTYLPTDEVQRLRDGLPGHIPLVLDCAYAEYVTRNDYSPGIELVEGGDNVIMTRTFSKIYGLAGLRVGWAYCPEAVAGVLHRVRGPFNVNAPAQAAAIAALRDVPHTEAARIHNDEWMPWLIEAFAELGLASIPSVGNFITTEFPGDDAGPALEFFKQHGVLARGVAGYHLPGHIRFSIGLAEENRKVIEVAKAFLDRQA